MTPAEAFVDESGVGVEMPHRLAVRPADLSAVRPTRWAWQGRLPIGSLSILLGAEGSGKGTLISWLIARLTCGELVGNLEGQPTRVLIVGDEDGFDSVVVPRLHAAGADLSRVFTISESDDLIDLRADAGRLHELLGSEGFGFVYFDALLDTLGADVDDWRSKHVRDAMRLLRRTARDLDICAVGALHPNKGTHTTFRGLLSGSHQFNALSRSSLLLAEHPDDSDRRLLVRGKGNLAKEPAGFEFSIASWADEINGYRFELPVVADEGDCDYGIADVLKPDRSSPIRDTLTEQIDRVGTGEIQSRADISRAVGREPNDRSVGRALDALEEQDRWRKVNRGQWQRIGIGMSKAMPMSTQSAGSQPAMNGASA
ncbi:MAG: AAA family ATPase [Solirubrobacterales bacterium]|nr:AAA family ATPase [Thermoleophilales bacterium]MCO5325528.1 AAA family ATPase [Solirubrobacterales bacterium]